MTTTMGVTQIVTILGKKEALRESLKKMSTEKVIFLASNQNIKDVIKMETKLPTEIKAVARNYTGLANLFKEHKEPVVHIIDHDFFNYTLVNAAFIAGVPVYTTNGNGLEKIPGLNLKLREKCFQMNLLLM